jgi:golgin subfamily B member 1
MSDFEKYQAILERDPHDTQAFVNLCNLAEKEGDFEYLAELLKYRAQISKQVEEVADLYFRAGEIYYDKLGDVTRAAEVLLEGFDRDSTHGGIGEKLDVIYREAQDWEGVVALAEQRLKALEQADVNGTKVVIRSDLHQQAGEIFDRAMKDEEQALNHYRKAIELDKSNLVAIYGAREIYYRTGKYKNAAKLCELEARVEKDDARRIALYRELAHILLTHLNEPEQAATALKRALKLNPEDEEVKLDLARTIASCKATPETQKDHRWASEFLLKASREVAPEETLDLAKLALMAAPESEKAVEFIEQKARELGDPNALTDVYEQVIARIGELRFQAPMIRRLAKVYLEEVGEPEKALVWMRKLEVMDVAEDKLFIAKLSKGVEARASQLPPPPPPPRTVEDEQPAYAAAPARPARAEEPEELLDAEEEPPRPAPVPAPAARREPSVAKKIPVASAPPLDPSDVEAFVAEMHQQAEKARRGGDDAGAEERMLQILDYAPHDQKATTYLERRFRARGDWSSLRDLLLRSAGAENLPPAVRTVRLREAARLSEEQLADFDGAIRAWRMIQESDPKVRDAADALKRLLADTERWDELIGILESEAEGSKNRTKRVECFHRLAEIYRVRIGDSARAAQAYKNVIELQPDDLEAIGALDELYLREQQYEELVPLLAKRAEMAKSREEKKGFLLRAAVMLRERLGLAEEAYARAKEILGMAPGDVETLELMESIDEEGEQWSRLLEVLTLRTRAAADKDDKLEVLRRKAHVATHRIGDAKIAVRAWIEVLDASPQDVEALDSLAEIHEKNRSFSELVEVLRKRLDTIENVPERADMQKRIAHILEDELDKPDAAMEYWRKVLDAGEDVESLGALSRYYERTGDFEQLVDVLQRQAPYAENLTERAAILFKRASLLYEKRKDKDEAIASLRLIANEVDPTHAPTLTLLRGILAEERRYEEAVEVLELHIAHAEDSDELKQLFVLLGDWVKQELDDKERALDAYERAAALDMSDVALLDVLDALYIELEQWDKLIKLLKMRYQAASEPVAKLDIVKRAGALCEEKLTDSEQAWGWYRLGFDALAADLPETIPFVEEAAARLGLWKQLIDVYGALTRAADPAEQVGWWVKISEVFDEKIGDAAQALEAVLRAFGLAPDDTGMLDRVDRIAVKAKNWQRLGQVYGVLAQRATDKERRIELLQRYATALHEQGAQHAMAFDIALKGFELDTKRGDLLDLVERSGSAAKRWDDLLRVYNACAAHEDDPTRKAELMLKGAAIARDNLDDAEGALGIALNVLRLDPFSQETVARIWELVRGLEAASLTSEKGVCWVKMIEAYRQLVAEHKHERDNQVDLLLIIAGLYAEEMSDSNSAFECLKEAQQLNPRDEQTIDKLEAMAGKHGFWESLSDHYSDILDESFEMDVAVLYHRRRARILADELGRPDEAAEHYWQIIQLDAKDEYAYGQLLRHYESTAKWNDLVNLLERQLDAASDPAKKREVVLQIAGIWESRIQNKFEARDWYRQALTMWPGCAEAQAGIARLEGGGKSDVVQASGGGEEEEDEDIKSLISIPPPASAAAVSDAAEPSEVAPLPATTAEAESEPEPQTASEAAPEPESEVAPEPEPEVAPEPSPVGDPGEAEEEAGVDAGGLVESEDEIPADDLIAEEAPEGEEDTTSLDDLLSLDDEEEKK